MDWLVFCLLRVPTFLSANSEIDRRRTLYRPVRRSLPVKALGGVSLTGRETNYDYKPFCTVLHLPQHSNNDQNYKQSNEGHSKDDRY